MRPVLKLLRCHYAQEVYLVVNNPSAADERLPDRHDVLQFLDILLASSGWEYLDDTEQLVPFRPVFLAGRIAPNASTI